MTADERTLWQKISNFKLDDPSAGFTFSARLARENGWKSNYTQRVIEEYKRFIFLCCIAEQGITPSDSIDQAWHLHLTYTRSYWIDFCQHTLGQEVHHNPTKGGNAEASKFDDYYTRSQKLYTEKFGEVPPTDIWHDNVTRFSDTDFQRFNLRTHRLISKHIFARLRKIVYFIAAVVLIAAVWLLIFVLPPEAYIPIGIFIGIAAVVLATFKYSRGGSSNNGSSCNSFSYDGDDDCGDGHNHGHDGDHGCGGHGCSSGCSGCSGSGCSGCGGD